MLTLCLAAMAVYMCFHTVLLAFASPNSRLPGNLRELCCRVLLESHVHIAQQLLRRAQQEGQEAEAEAAARAAAAAPDGA